jgi:hypothetical protein
MNGNFIEEKSEKVSWFRNKRDPRPSGSVGIKLLYQIIVDPDSGGLPIQTAANIVDGIRTGQLPKEDKLNLPCFCPSAEIRNNISTFNASKLVSNSGYTQIDIDPKENPTILKTLADAEVLRDSLAGLPFVKLAALSASGRGVWLLVSVPDGRLKEYFRAYRLYFENHGVKIDPSKGTRENQFRFYAPDPGAILNNTCEPIDLPEPEPLPEPKPLKKPSVTSDDISPIQDFNERGDAVNLLRNFGYRIVETLPNKTRMRSPQATHTNKENFNCEFDSAKNFLYIWSPNCQPFKENCSYRPASIYALICGIDPDCPRDLHRSLRDAGYGTQPKPLPF